MGVIRASPSQMHGRGINLVIISILFVFTATCLVVSRIISRHVTGRGLGHDDFAITLAWVSELDTINADDEPSSCR